jgi:hypothetical protein
VPYAGPSARGWRESGARPRLTGQLAQLGVMRASKSSEFRSLGWPTSIMRLEVQTPRALIRSSFSYWVRAAACCELAASRAGCTPHFT